MSEHHKYHWPTAPAMGFSGSAIDHAWHVAINQHSTEEMERGQDFPRWMYEAKRAAATVPGAAARFKQEREGTLCKTFRRCSCCSDQKHVVDNHLTCCLGVECRKCPHLLALDKAQLPAETIDWLKAWTCVGHILAKGGDPAGEGFILTVDDRMFWDGLHENLAAAYGDDSDREER